MSDLFPGWYPDPEVEDQDRWWNGIGWVDRVMPKGRTEVQISPLSQHQPAPNISPASSADEIQPHETQPHETGSVEQMDSDTTETAETDQVVVDLRSDERAIDPKNQPDQPPTDDSSADDSSADDRSARSRRDLPTVPVVDTYIAWDGLAYEGRPPEGWHLASDERWWAPDTGPDASPGTDSSTEVASTATIDPAATIIAPPKAKTDSGASSFSLPATSYNRLEKLPAAQGTSKVDSKKSSWWKRRKN